MAPNARRHMPNGVRFAVLIAAYALAIVGTLATYWFSVSTSTLCEPPPPFNGDTDFAPIIGDRCFFIGGLRLPMWAGIVLAIVVGAVLVSAGQALASMVVDDIDKEAAAARTESQSESLEIEEDEEPMGDGDRPR